MSSESIPAPPNPRSYSPDHIVLYGIKLNIDGDTAGIPIEGRMLRLAVTPFDSDKPVSSKKVAIAVIYGYAFEGHCYRCDRPRLLVFEPSRTEVDAKGCGFDGQGYTMWQITAKTRLLELATSVDFAEEVVLNANLPGNRSPNTYGNNFQLAHRGGRLNRTNGT